MWRWLSQHADMIRDPGCTSRRMSSQAVPACPRRRWPVQPTVTYRDSLPACHATHPRLSRRLSTSIPLHIHSQQLLGAGRIYVMPTAGLVHTGHRAPHTLRCVTLLYTSMTHRTVCRADSSTRKRFAFNKPMMQRAVRGAQGCRRVRAATQVLGAWLVRAVGQGSGAPAGSRGGRRCPQALALAAVAVWLLAVKALCAPRFVTNRRHNRHNTGPIPMWCFPNTRRSRCMKCSTVGFIQRAGASRCSAGACWFRNCHICPGSRHGCRRLSGLGQQLRQRRTCTDRSHGHKQPSSRNSAPLALKQNPSPPTHVRCRAPFRSPGDSIIMQTVLSQSRAVCTLAPAPAHLKRGPPASCPPCQRPVRRWGSAEAAPDTPLRGPAPESGQRLIMQTQLQGSCRDA